MVGVYNWWSDNYSDSELSKSGVQFSLSTSSPSCTIFGSGGCWTLTSSWRKPLGVPKDTSKDKFPNTNLYNTN